jgi:hypothetical protein
MTASPTRKAASVSTFPYTSRLQKGGALLDDMRQLVRTWRDEPVEEQRETGIRSNILNKQTRKRLADVYRRAFLPRFINGPIPNAWKVVRPLEDDHAPIQILRPVYYWITANAEPLLGDFCREVLLADHAAGTTFETEDVLRWLISKRCPWSVAAATRVARSLLAALRDFGILEGRSRKRLASRSLPVESFAYLAFCLRRNGIASRALLSHPDWQLFLLQPSDVEHFFLLAHQEGLLEYHAAGSLLNINFQTDSLEEYARVVAKRSI